MNKKVWIFQYPKDIRAKGAANASWFVGWYDLAGKRHSESCGPGAAGKDKAVKRQRRLQSELDMRVHQPRSRDLWQDFREEFETEVLSGMEATTKRAFLGAFEAFERHTGIRRMAQIDTLLIDRFTRKRQEDPGR